MREIAILGAGLLGSLVLAYTVWTDDGSGAATDEVAVYRAAPSDLAAVTWTSATETVTLERRADAFGEYVWLTATETVEVPVDGAAPDVDPDSGAAGGEPPADAPEPAVRTETRTVSFRGNSAADDLWADFAPLMALRELVGATGTAAFGLDDPTATVSVRTASGAVELVVGGETYGSRDRYVSADGRLYLVDDRTLRPLQYARTRLVERNLFPTAQEEIHAITLEVDGVSATWTHRNPDDRRGAFWARDGGEAADAAGETWITKALAVRASAYVDEAELDGALVPVVRFSVQDGERAWPVEILRAEGEGEGRAWYARSAYNRSTVELTPSLAADAFADAAAVVAP